MKILKNLNIYNFFNQKPCRGNFQRRERNCCQGDGPKPLQNQGKGSTAPKPRSRFTPLRPIQPQKAAMRLPLRGPKGCGGSHLPMSMTAMAGRSGARAGALRYRSLTQRGAAGDARWGPLQTPLWSASSTWRPLLASQSRQPRPCSAGRGYKVELGSIAGWGGDANSPPSREAPTKPQVFWR